MLPGLTNVSPQPTFGELASRFGYPADEEYDDPGDVEYDGDLLMPPLSRWCTLKTSMMKLQTLQIGMTSLKVQRCMI